MIILQLLEQSRCRHVFSRMSALPQALDCIVFFQLILGEIKRHHMSGLRDKKKLVHCCRAFILQNAGGIRKMLI